MEVRNLGRQGKRDRLLFFFSFFFFFLNYEGKKGEFGDRKRELRDIILFHVVKNTKLPFNCLLDTT